MHEATCRRCGEVKDACDFRPNAKLKSGLSSWCSDCHREAVRESRRKHGERYNATRRKAPTKATQCTQCTETFTQPQAAKALYCSNDCRDAAARARRRHRPRTGIPTPCALCGRVTNKRSRELKRYGVAYCSRRCSGKAAAIARGESLRSRELVGPIARRAISIIEVPGEACAPRTFYCGNCPECGGVVTTINRRGRFCSKRCAKRTLSRDAKHRKRAAHKTERIYRRRVFERDDWTCRLCKRPVDPGAKVPEPLAPTIDHILPTSLGGDHTYENVQTACFACNSKKGNRVTQLALGC